MVKITQKNWITLGIATIISLTTPAAIYSMETDRERQEVVELFFKKLPAEIQHKIALTWSQKALEFLSKTFDYVEQGQDQEIIQTDITSMVMDNNTIAVGTSNGILKIFNIKYLEEKYDIFQKRKIQITEESSFEYDKSIKSIAMSGNLVAIRFNDMVDVFDIKKKKSIKTFEKTNIITSIAIHDNILVIGTKENKAPLFDLKQMKFIHTIRGYTGAISSVAIDNPIVVIGTINNDASIWNIQSVQRLYHADFNSNITCVAIDKNIVGIGSADGVLTLINIDPESLDSLQIHTKSITSIAISNDIIITSSKDGTIGVIDILSQRDFNLKGYPDIISVATNDNYLAIANNKRIQILAIRNQLQGSADNNAFIWIIENANLPQLNLIKRAYETTAAGQEFIISFPSEDAKIFLSFPKHVQRYLLNRLDIRR